VATGVDPAGAAALSDDLANAHNAVVIGWVGHLSGRRQLLGPADLRRTRAHLRILLARLSPHPRSRSILGYALDDLAALGQPQPGIDRMLHSWRLAPDSLGARNNLAYARLLGGAPGEQVWRFAAPSLGSPSGRSAHALLDTLAAALWSAGRKDEALTTLHGALRAGTRYSGGGLPQVRLAEYLLETGDRQGAIDMALVALDDSRGSQRHLVGGEFWQVRFDVFDAATRARAVLRRALRRGP